MKAFGSNDTVFFSAVGIMDRYMAIMSIKNDKYPSLVNISVVCLQLAVKLENMYIEGGSYSDMIEYLKMF